LIGAIDWNVTSELIEGWATPNKYGLLFVSGLILGYLVMKRIFKRESIPEEQLDKLLIYVVFATIIGARLGHVFFYDWPSYRENPIDIFKVWEGGLASHGAAIAIIAALYVFSKKVSKQSFMWLLDRVVISVTIGACFIRLGNLVNHEIIGIPSDLPWAFIFNYSGMEYEINGVQVPRHPAQLYEAIYYLFTFFLLMYLYWKTNARLRQGILFGTFMIVLWFGRFMIEFVKEGQTERDHFGALNTGQILSIPLIIVGIIFLYRGLKKKVVDETTTA
jgi:phosphatidylglycerol:prolipoprotein diacylglycerol transferase